MTRPEPAWGPTGKDVYRRTYSRKMANGTQESWEDTVLRVVDGNMSLVDAKFHEKGEREKLVDLFYNFKALPAGRHLWMSGVPGRQFLMNCWRAGFVEDIHEHFRFTFDQLMQGGGVGANYSNRYLKRYGVIKHPVAVHIVCDPEHPDYQEFASYVSSEYSHEWTGSIRIEDTREGWSDALSKLIVAFWNGETQLVFDVSLIRHRGAPIRTFGGTAAGPGPLVFLLSLVATLLTDRVGQKLSSLDAMTIDHYIADAVVSGNVRRSARMSIKHWADPDIFDFINCKQGAYGHWSTNISVEIDDAFFRALKKKDEHATRVYQEVVRGMCFRGEPGFYNSSLASEGEFGDVGSTNPCVTGDTWVMTASGPRRVFDLIDQPVHLIIDSQIYSSSGFFKTGEKEAFTLSTREGYTLNLTSDHKVLTRDNIWIEAGNLTEGDKIVLSNHDQAPSWQGDGTRSDGYVVGHFIGDGTWASTIARLGSWDQPGEDTVRELIARKLGPEWKQGTNNWYLNATSIVSEYLVAGSKALNDKIQKSSSAFYAGLLCGLFDADGHVEGNSTKGGLSIRLSQSNLDFLQDVQRMLARFGIRSTINMAREAGPKTMPDGRGGHASYDTKTNWRLIISSDCDRFMRYIGFGNPVKRAKFENRRLEMTRGFYEKPFEATFLSLESIGVQDVYDAQVPGVNAFDANGLYVHNCGEISLNPFEYCCLGHVNLATFYDDYEGAAEAHRLMTRFLIRATFCDIPDEKSREVGSLNRRIGVGHFGFQGWLVKQNIRYSDSHRSPYVRKTLKDLYEVVRKEARRFAFQLRIPEPIKVTTMAPTGSIAKLSGDTEGGHPIYARYFKRRIRFSTVDPMQIEQLSEYEVLGYPIEDDLYSRNTKVVTFYTKDPLVAKVEELGLDADYLVEGADEIEVADMLAVQAMYQECWADNAVSFTVNMPSGPYRDKFFTDEALHAGDVNFGHDSAFLENVSKEVYAHADQVASILIHYLPKLKGTTMMVDGSRPQAPYERITREEYELSQLGSINDGFDENCASGACPIK